MKDVRGSSARSRARWSLVAQAFLPVLFLVSIIVNAAKGRERTVIASVLLGFDCRVSGTKIRCQPFENSSPFVNLIAQRRAFDPFHALDARKKPLLLGDAAKAELTGPNLSECDACNGMAVICAI